MRVYVYLGCYSKEKRGSELGSHTLYTHRIFKWYCFHATASMMGSIMTQGETQGSVSGASRLRSTSCSLALSSSSLVFKVSDSVCRLAKVSLGCCSWVAILTVRCPGDLRSGAKVMMEMRWRQADARRPRPQQYIAALLRFLIYKHIPNAPLRSSFRLQNSI